MLKSAYGEECLSRTSVFEWRKMFKEAQKLRMQKSLMKTLLTAFFDAKCIIDHEFVQEKQVVNGKFYKHVIKRLIARAHRVRSEFQESGSWCLLHRDAPAHSSGVVSVLSRTPYSPDLAPADFLLFPNCDERDEIRGCCIDPADCDERTEGDTGRSVFSGIRFVV
jgi:hypothetical protein